MAALQTQCMSDLPEVRMLDSAFPNIPPSRAFLLLCLVRTGRCKAHQPSCVMFWVRLSAISKRKILATPRRSAEAYLQAARCIPGSRRESHR